MLKYSLLLIPFLFLGCEPTFDNTIDVSQNNYQVVSIAGIKDTVDLKEPGDSILSVRVIFAQGSQFNSAYFDIYSSINQKPNSSGIELVPISTNIYQNSFELEKEFPIGNYTVRIFVVGMDGNTNQVALNTFYFNNGQDNVAPIISNLVIPDSVSRNVTFIFNVTAEDSNGLNDIAIVYFELLRPDGTPVEVSPGNTRFLMHDDGNFLVWGDQTAGDGIFSYKNLFSSTAQTGQWRFVFQARDRSGSYSNIIEHLMIVF
jgi:hypothetical protein